MEGIQLTGTQERYTAVPNLFLDRYLPGADGEFVKVYLLLWRYYTAGQAISVTELADRMDDTEKDILRGIRYWEKQKLLACTTNERGQITGIRFLPVRSEEQEEAAPEASKQKEPVPQEADQRGDAPRAALPEGRRQEERYQQGSCQAEHYQEEGHQEVRPQKERSSRAAAGKQETNRSVKAATHKRLALDEDFGQLVYIVGKYLNRNLRQADSQILEYLYGELNLSAELLEYLVESCVDAGHTSLHYIEKIALDWHERGIRTVEEAREQAEISRKQYYQILKAFGISRRGPAPEEKKLMDLWLHEYSFSMDIILEACSRTIRATHEPSFEYANGILADWKKKGVKSSGDITAQDELFQKKREAEKNGAKGPARNRFHNYEQSGYDYDRILADLNQ